MVVIVVSPVEGTQDATGTAIRLLLTDAPAVLLCPLLPEAPKRSTGCAG